MAKLVSVELFCLCFEGEVVAQRWLPVAQPAARRQEDVRCGAATTPTPPAQSLTSDESPCSRIVAPTHHALGLTRASSASTAVPSS